MSSKSRWYSFDETGLHLRYSDMTWSGTKRLTVCMRIKDERAQSSGHIEVEDSRKKQQVCNLSHFVAPDYVGQYTPRYGISIEFLLELIVTLPNKWQEIGYNHFELNGSLGALIHIDLGLDINPNIIYDTKQWESLSSRFSLQIFATNDTLLVVCATALTTHNSVCKALHCMLGTAFDGVLAVDGKGIVCTLFCDNLETVFHLLKAAIDDVYTADNTHTAIAHLDDELWTDNPDLMAAYGKERTVVHCVSSGDIAWIIVGLQKTVVAAVADALLGVVLTVPMVLPRSHLHYNKLVELLWIMVTHLGSIFENYKHDLWLPMTVIHFRPELYSLVDAGGLMKTLG